MAKLLMPSKHAPKSAATTRIGGVPAAPKGTAWPLCKECQGRLMFLGQIYLPETGIQSLAGREQMLLVFQCQNNTAVCDDWDADTGANAILVVPAQGLVAMKPPKVTAEDEENGAGPAWLDGEQAVRIIDYDNSRQEESDDDAYMDLMRSKGTPPIGKLGGRPSWQGGGDETPKCSCKRKMIFVAQIEDTAVDGINFGGCGSGYVFACAHCQDKGKFVWQR